MRSKGLVVLHLGESLVLGQFWLQVLFPFVLAERLGLCDARGSMLGGICPGGCQDFLVDCFVIGSCELNIRSSVRMVVRLDMGRDGMLELEIRFADPGRGVSAFFECSWTPEEDAQDGVPCKKPANDESVSV